MVQTFTPERTWREMKALSEEEAEALCRGSLRRRAIKSAVGTEEGS
jgi:hypothetical protein